MFCAHTHTAFVECDDCCGAIARGAFAMHDVGRCTIDQAVDRAVDQCHWESAWHSASERASACENFELTGALALALAIDALLFERGSLLSFGVWRKCGAVFRRDWKKGPPSKILIRSSVTHVANRTRVTNGKRQANEATTHAAASKWRTQQQW